MSGCECPPEDPAVLQAGDFPAHSSGAGGWQKGVSIFPSSPLPSKCSLCSPEAAWLLEGFMGRCLDDKG